MVHTWLQNILRKFQIFYERLPRLSRVVSNFEYDAKSAVFGQYGREVIQPIEWLALWYHYKVAGFYRYSPLEPGQFRVITILPGQEPNAIACSVTIAELADPLPYEALSYAWGNVYDVCTIQLDGKPLYITRSLHTALVRLRRVDSLKTIWVDGISINQRDTREREQQVVQMRHIYRFAERVIVWFGEAANDSEKIPNLIQGQIEYDKLSKDGQESLGCDQTNRATGNSMDPLQFLRRRPWFRRVWVVQEAVMASEITVMCGEWEISWLDFVQHGMFVSDKPDDNRTISTETTGGFEAMVGLIAMIILGAGQETKHPRKLIQILSGMRGLRATDPRDHIYGVLGLSIEADEVVLQPDYDIDPLKLYIQAAKFFVDHGQGIEVLYSALLSRSVEDYRLPSWVPDWSSNNVPLRRIAPHFMLTREEEYDQCCYQAAKDTTSLISTNLDSNNLSVAGVMFDSITFMPSTYLKERENPGFGQVMTTTSYALEEISSILDSNYTTKESRKAVIWRTAICDMSMATILPIQAANAHVEGSAYDDYITICEGRSPDSLDQAHPNEDQQKVRNALAFASSVASLWTAWKRAKTSTGYIGHVPIPTQPGD